MKAEELRVGNLVDLGNRISKVIEINYWGCVVLDLEETQDTIEGYERIKPIPLTEELLLRFGLRHLYKEIDNQNFYRIDINSINYLTYDPRKKTISLHHKSYGVYFTKECQYVHQLQNLYFALTGEELTLK